MPVVSDLPEIPDKRYFTISEAAALCLMKPHVLRYWETEFAQLKPARRKNRRYYRPQDIELVRQIRALLYEQGYTIQGAKTYLKRRVQTGFPPLAQPSLCEELKTVLEILAE